MITSLVAIAAGVGLLTAVAKLSVILGRTRDPARRAVWLVFAALGLAMAGHLPPAYQTINALAGFNAHWPIVFTLIVSAMYFFQMFFVYSIHSGTPAVARRLSRRGLLLVLATSVAMIVPFLLRPDATDFVFGPAGRFATGGPGNKIAEIAGLAFASYLIFAGVNLTVLARRWALRAEPGGLRAGLRFLTVGSALGTAVALHSGGYIIALMVDVVPPWPEAAVAAWLVPVICVVQLIGVVLPAMWPRVVRWRLYRRALRDLYPLWARMVIAKPCVLPEPMRPAWRDQLQIVGLYGALYRRWVEIGDVRDELRRYTPDGLEQQLRDHARAHGGRGDHLENLVEAALIMEGLGALRRGDRPEIPAHTTAQPAGARAEFLTEVARWRAVAAAVDSPETTQLIDHVDATDRGVHRPV